MRRIDNGDRIIPPGGEPLPRGEASEPQFAGLGFEEQGGDAPINVAESKASGAMHLVFLQVRVIPKIQAEREVRQRISEVGHLHGANRHAGEFIVGKTRPSGHSQRARMDGDSDDFVGVG